jgi:hypothetical protein
VHDDFRAVAVLFLRQDDLCGNRAVVQKSTQADEALVDQLADVWGDVYVTAGDVQSHGGS